MKPLTRTEKNILDLVGQGKSTNQIAFALDMTEHSVEGLRRSMLSKFGAKNSAEMMKKAMEANAVNPSNEESSNPRLQ